MSPTGITTGYRCSRRPVNCSALFPGDYTREVADVAVSPDGLLYAASRENSSVTVMNAADGSLIGYLGSGYGVAAFDGFEYVFGMDADTDGNLYVCDGFGNVPIIKMFDANGNFITRWGGWGRAQGLFQGGCFIKAENPQNIYITDMHNHRVQKFAFPAGEPRRAARAGEPAWTQGRSLYRKPWR